MHVGQRVVDLLVEAGIRSAFGVPGGQTSPLYNGMAVRRDAIRHVLMRDERSAVFAADAYARTTGRAGACDATVGPGATNLVSGLVEARSSSIPLIAIVADIPRAWEHRRHLGSASQGFEQRAFLEPCVKWFGHVGVPEAIDDVVGQALRVATSNRPGPVVVEIPDDVFSADAVEAPLPPVDARYPRFRSAPDPDAVRDAAHVIGRSRRPMLLLGGGAQIAGAGTEARALVERLRVPFSTTISGKGLIEETHPLAMGISGSFGVPVANDLLAESDCLIVVGAKLGQAATLGWDLPAPGAAVVHLDVDAEEIGRNSPALGLHGDAALGLRALLDALSTAELSFDWDVGDLTRRAADWWDGEHVLARPREGDAVKPQDVVGLIGGRLGEADLVVTDASLSSGWMGSGWRVEQPGRRILAPRGVAGLGWGLPAAVGAAFGLADVGSQGRVVCLAGDGGWGYSLTEVETLARFEMPVVSVVLNNSVLGWNKHVVQRRYAGDYVSQDFGDVDYAATARSLGAHAVRVDRIEDVDAALDEAFAVQGKPSVVEVVSSEWETPVIKPMSGQSAPARASY
ncbi:thiamine pyrophosphate-binding protein [Blastococcus mobilis]|uniref:Acetolactate synthase-1/2/3 large subunit n=1 Tax=Blastococcus mobilis TaxID=1938746 RepID=A0A238Y2N9_9ACTN|nr:thiamine pyrophosphate-binding protein [Blastococcus mobilis]SNR65387.1 acetolactate synthase-1/2/3 large subunit [Blastococcus mobilis]